MLEEHDTRCIDSSLAMTGILASVSSPQLLPSVLIPFTLHWSLGLTIHIHRVGCLASFLFTVLASRIRLSPCFLLPSVVLSPEL
ncbi:uncharacterized protein ARMOST_06066 [Armillaria ostoyae]|uniref:Uncharacterized protein n=1 Tax=Armillaria ostoyae TaxID=47428 RepID=A0A284R203_ARMOS|nr:uncharacterized protein ARMOST_06066 [Armillaria ostoyae]